MRHVRNFRSKFITNVGKVIIKCINNFPRIICVLATRSFYFFNIITFPFFAKYFIDYRPNSFRFISRSLKFRIIIIFLSIFDDTIKEIAVIFISIYIFKGTIFPFNKIKLVLPCYRFINGNIDEEVNVYLQLYRKFY